MLTFHLSSKRKKQPAKVVELLPPAKKEETPRQVAIVEAFNQKDLIIKEELKKAHYEKGSIVRPVRTEDFNEFGYGRVRGIVQSYKDWPASSEFPTAPAKPMLVLVESLDKPSSYNCTVSFVRAVTKTEMDFINEKTQ